MAKKNPTLQAIEELRDNLNERIRLASQQIANLEEQQRALDGIFKTVQAIRANRKAQRNAKAKATPATPTAA